MMLWKCCTRYASKFGKLSSGQRTGKGQSAFQSQKKAMPKNPQTTALISQASKVMCKILQARLQQYMNQALPDVQAGFRKGRRTESNCQHPLDHRERRGIPEKHLLLSTSLTTLKPLTVWIATNCGKFLNRWEHQTTLPTSEKPVCGSRSNS